MVIMFLENIIVCSSYPLSQTNLPLLRSFSVFYSFSSTSVSYKVFCFQFCVVMFALLPKLSFSKGEVIMLYSNHLKTNSQELLCSTLHKELWWNQSLFSRPFHLLSLLTAVQPFMVWLKRIRLDPGCQGHRWSLVFQKYFFLPELVKSKRF